MRKPINCTRAKGGHRTLNTRQHCQLKGGRHHHFQARPRRSYYDDPKRLNFRGRMGSGALLLVWSRSLIEGRIVYSIKFGAKANVGECRLFFPLTTSHHPPPTYSIILEPYVFVCIHSSSTCILVQCIPSCHPYPPLYSYISIHMTLFI